MTTCLINFVTIALMTPVFLAAMILLWARVFRAKRTDPTCGHCGYSMVGQVNMQCPECGSDLREAGIWPPVSGGMKPLTFIALWTLFYFQFIGCVSYFTDSWLPERCNRHGTLDFLQPDSKLWNGLTIDWSAEMSYDSHNLQKSPLISGQYKLVMAKPPNQTSPLTVDMINGNYHYTNAKGRNVSGNTNNNIQETLIDWLNSNSVDTTNEAVKIEISDITITIEDMLLTLPKGKFPRTADIIIMNQKINSSPNNAAERRHGSAFHGSGATCSGRGAYKVWIWPAMLGFLALVIWAYGIKFYFKARRKHRKIFAQAKQHWPAA